MLNVDEAPCNRIVFTLLCILWNITVRRVNINYTYRERVIKFIFNAKFVETFQVASELDVMTTLCASVMPG